MKKEYLVPRLNIFKSYNISLLAASSGVETGNSVNKVYNPYDETYSKENSFYDIDEEEEDFFPE